MEKLEFERVIRKSEERLYFTIPFEAPENTAKMEIAYDYPRFRTVEADGVTRREEINIIDLALSAPGGEYVGASGVPAAMPACPCGPEPGKSSWEHTRWHRRA